MSKTLETLVAEIKIQSHNTQDQLTKIEEDLRELIKLTQKNHSETEILRNDFMNHRTNDREKHEIIDKRLDMLEENQSEIKLDLKGFVTKVTTYSSMITSVIILVVGAILNWLFSK